MLICIKRWRAMAFMIAFWLQGDLVMQNQHSGFEIVEVFSDCRLWDAQSKEQLYQRRDCTSLAPGFYVVNWPAGHRTFREDSLFHGPFQQRQAAEAFLKKLKARAEAGQIDAATGRGAISAQGSSSNPAMERRPA